MRCGVGACGALAAAFLALPAPAPGAVAEPTLPERFRETVVFDGLTFPTAVRFLADGRVFVAEKGGRIKVFNGLEDQTPTLFVDLSDRVYEFHERGLLGLELDPSFDLEPYVYVLYALDALPGGSTPYWNDTCPDPVTNGCVVPARLARIRATGDVGGEEEVLLEGWCQQFLSHSIGGLAFDSERALYVTGGDGASSGVVDYGQAGNPANACGDPAGEGGALRSQDLRTTDDPTGFNGSLLRVDPDTGDALPTNPLYSSSDPNARRIVAHGFRNPFRFTVRPGSREIWIGDVGWVTAEEVNRIADAADPTVENFGWPCFEGTARQAGYDAADLALCEDLYEEEGAVTNPTYSYGRFEDVVPDDTCPNGMTISALEFYERGTYPEEYEGALFFADLARSCIWVVFPGPDGQPDFQTREVFLAGASALIDLQAGPGGDLFYVDLYGGRIRRLEYARPTQPPSVSQNTLPTARVVASSSTGAAPLAVSFDASGSSEPDPGDALSYAWDLDGDRVFDDGVGPAATRLFAAPGTFRIRVRASDRHGAGDEAEAVVRIQGYRPLLQLVQLDVSRRNGGYVALLRFRACDDSSTPLLIHRQELVGGSPSRSFYRYIRGTEGKCRRYALTWKLASGLRAGHRYRLLVRLADAQLNWSATVARAGRF